MDIYSLSNNNWKHILSISNQWHCICKSEWDRNFEHNVTRAEILKLLKQRTYKIKITGKKMFDRRISGNTFSSAWTPLLCNELLILLFNLIHWKLNIQDIATVFKLLSFISLRKSYYCNSVPFHCVNFLVLGDFEGGVPGRVFSELVLKPTYVC